MVKLISDISTSGKDRNMNISIAMFGFMGIPAGYLFSRWYEKWANYESANYESDCQISLVVACHLCRMLHVTFELCDVPTLIEVLVKLFELLNMDFENPF
jgi:hypothetical protein